MKYFTRQLLLIIAASAIAMLTTSVSASLTAEEIENLRSSCEQNQLTGPEKKTRYFTLSPEIEMDNCIVIDAFNTHALTHTSKRELYAFSLERISDRKELLMNALKELRHLSHLYAADKTGFPAHWTKRTKNAYAKDMVSKVIVLIHLMLKHEGFLKAGDPLALTIEEQTQVLTTLQKLSSDLGRHLYAYDLFSRQCAPNTCPRMLFMAPILWTDILYRLHRYSPLSKDVIQNIIPQLNLMLEAHSQAAMGLPLFTTIDDPRDNKSYGVAKRAYEAALQNRGGMSRERDLHDNFEGGASFKIWFILRGSDDLHLTLKQRLDYANDAFHYAELSRERVASILMDNNIHPSTGEALLNLESFSRQMFNSTVARTQTETVIELISVFGQLNNGDQAELHPDDPYLDISD
ncbi:hypothetical protein [Parendozoicomonas haliclonae]|uniref:Uncharacterized protein n=1 Tax=Parendozoicomonas haliclonae TaxID=1960125 RepID=A0A1X7ADC3_9GAMM|nr:hypothetical protein [Parendozoicomonas haliclonae]SMA31517.1 hypothetical protein EHSB41UT_00021 [Parendozoicomonas haliclonae]